MNKQKAFEYIEKIKSKYYDCSTPKCGENGLCWDCNGLKPIINLFDYISMLELTIFNKPIQNSNNTDDSLNISNQTIDLLKEKIETLEKENKEMNLYVNNLNEEIKSLKYKNHSLVGTNSEYQNQITKLEKYKERFNELEDKIKEAVDILETETEI
jgi:DNA repair exonuclease SbcCD ATPase subunit